MAYNSLLTAPEGCGHDDKYRVTGVRAQLFLILAKTVF